jgi:hypothetical protein
MDIPKRPQNFTSWEAEFDIAYYLMNKGDIVGAKNHLTFITQEVCFDENFERLGTLEVAKEKYS